MTIGSFSWGGGANDWYARSKSWNGADSPVVFDPIKRRYRRDKNRDNPYTMSSRHMERSPITVKTGSTTWTGWQFGTSCVNTANEPAWNANAELALLAKLAEKIKGHDFSGGVFLAEGGQALATIRNSALAVFDLYKGVKRRDVDEIFRSLARITGHKPPPKKWFQSKLRLDDLSGAWLAIQYAWKPLLTDVHEACKAIKRMSDGHRGLEFKASHSLFGPYEGSASPSSYKITMGFKHTVRYIYRLKEAPSEQETWGLYDPEVVAWELVPFSFVVDWFVPVGTFLEDRAFFRRLSGSWVRTDFNRRWVMEAVETPPPQYPILIRGSYKEQQIQFTRTVGSGSLAVPKPELKLLDKVFSKTHIQNAAALIVSLTTNARKTIARDGLPLKATDYTE